MLNANQLNDLNAHLLLRISDCFIKRYVQNESHDSDPDREKVKANPTTMVEFLRHKAQLYRFFDQVTEKISDDKVWRLICRIKSSLKEGGKVWPGVLLPTSPNPPNLQVPQAGVDG